MAFTITWHEFDVRHHSGDLSTGDHVVKGAVVITLRGGEAVFDGYLKGK